MTFFFFYTDKEYQLNFLKIKITCITLIYVDAIQAIY